MCVVLPHRSTTPAILCIDVHLSFVNCPFLSFQYWRCNHNSTISFISKDLETECVCLSFDLHWKHRRSNSSTCRWSCQKLVKCISLSFSTLVFLLELNNISADLELECVAVSSFLPPVENAWTWGLRRCCCRSLDGYSATKSWVITCAWAFML